MEELPPPSVMLDKIVIEQTIAQFAATDLALVHVPPPNPPPSKAELAGMVGFTSDKMRGTVMIASSFQVFARSRPAAVRGQALSIEAARDWLYLRDWASELTNQLMGRIKNRCVNFGIALNVSTPTALSGSALAFTAPTSNRARSHRFSSDGDELWVFFDAIVEPDTKLATQSESAASEGDVILF